MSQFRDETMLQRSPFHEKIKALCEINQWAEWKGYTTPDAYFDVELEYFAIRSCTGVFDLSPMTKYKITGADAEAYLNRLVTRDVTKLKQGRVGYTVWCNDEGQVMDDGTIFHISENNYLLCSYTRAMDWLSWSAMGFDVSIEDVTDKIAALAVQGPTSCATLRQMGLTGLEDLKSFGIAHFDFQGVNLMVSRTGFTGDLGYELWIELNKAEDLWDAVFEAGADRGIRPFGSHALDLARIEAGFVQSTVDFIPAQEQIRPGRSRSPFELGLEWLVDLDKPIFNGRRALLKEKQQGSRYRFVYLDVEGNKPAEHSFIYQGNKQIGTVTSAAFCPTAKSNFAFAQIDANYGIVGDELIAEIYYQRELQWSKVLAKCTVIDKPLFNPPHRRKTPAADF